ncbi:ubiquitin carboxyl-terminal hydrolase 24 isoform X2 [Latimeria chalumnae]|uniref:ubiquitin carboxyl-terminal hydrolase 24 isoform X2 n=1 Tax=Latimeria chalumnae TaxID=7897 RepID=UPI0006D8F435|nr:PREDICTED: ubiquitin carboxyl-terminal hydrolase 24 [Latimeria chalumnae]|eukprot:XP_014349690.1 PREDICTED: ubiquitin carboxyl-terminal hydrolase 24 [Latimeria chalumnae]
METEEEQHMTTLLCMGFSDPMAIRKALRMAKNDINEAVALLTNESPGLGYGYEPMESGPGSGGDGGGGGGSSSSGSGGGGGSSSSGGRTGGGSGFDPPPAYHEVVEPTEKNDENGNCSGGNIEFPTTNLYELESRVFTDHWSIPYKREESLGKCLIASTCLAKLGLADADENCKRFMDRCMSEAFKKLLTSGAVHKWGTEIHEGIYNMLMLLVDLVAERVKQDPIPINLMGVLAMAFNPDHEYHIKNRMKTCQRNWSEVFGEGNMYAISPPSNYQKEPHGWLIDLVNRFGEMGGFAAIQAKLNSEGIELAGVSALVQPLGVCAEYLNSTIVQPMLDPVIHKMIRYVQNVEEKDLKDKRLVSIPELLSAIKLLCMRFQPDLVTVVDDLRLDILLRMLKSPHFSAKMNSLKEVTKLIEDSCKSLKIAIDTDRLLDWLVENSVLSIALEGNIDQAQYCDRIKGIIELLGSKLSLDELTKIWRIQSGQSSTVIENIQTIIAAAAAKFSSDQLNHLFVLIQKSWETETDRVRQKLLSLIGRIGREARFETTTGKVLEVLWELAHLPTLPCTLVQQALEEHLTILSDTYAVKEAVKKSYIIKCIEDIKRSAQQNNTQSMWVVPALRHLHEITRSFIKQTYQKQDKSIIQDLKKNFEIVKLVTGSLVACHRLAVFVAGHGGLSGLTLVDRYTYQEYLEAHLKFLAFFLQEATLYLGWNRAKEIWECLITGPDICELDREMCFEWFTKGQHDLESDVQQQLFKEKILKLEPYEITMNGFNLFKAFFENVNLCDHRLKRQGTQLHVEKPELTGMDFIWRIAMESPDEEIANEAIQLIINYSYINLNPRLKKDSVSLHKKFIGECYKRLEAASSALGGPTLTHAVTRATKMLTATAMPTVATSVQSPSSYLICRSTKLVIIERLLLLAERYVITIEDLYSIPRTILPHGASFHGHPLTLNATYESTKDTFTVEAHSNETFGSIRWKIAKHLNYPVDNMQIFTNECLLTVNKDHKLLHQLGFSDEQTLTVKTSGSGTPSGSSVDSSAGASSSGVFNSAYVTEQEKSLPGVVMAIVYNVFDMLYQLANLEEPRITVRVRKLLLLIPTDQAIQEALDQLDSLGRKKTLLSESSSSQSSKSPSLSSKQHHQPNASSILESLFRSSAPGMSTFRVLYNLEVLSSKLMPTSDDEMARNCAKSFCENFLKAGGLSLVVNVMQRDSIPSEVDYETRQGVYSICLQLARFLLVGQTMPTSLDEDFMKDGADTLSLRPFRNMTRQSSKQVSLCGTPEKSSHRQLSVSDRSSIRVEEIIPAARVAIQTMDVNDFTSTVACFMRLTWAAAAGRLDLVGSSQPIRECSNSLFPVGIRSRLSSSGSNCSSGSEGESSTLHAGICVRQQMVSTIDAIIAGEALSLLVTCLQLRSQQLGSFYTLLCVSDFIIDILLGSASAEVRHVACDQLYTLSQTDTSSYPDVQKPNQFLLRVILTAQLPLWSPTSIMRGINQRLLSQCTEYFDLRCQLLDDLTSSEMEQLNLSPASMLEDEITWLDNFEPTWTAECETSEADNILLAGHLRLIKTLLSLCGAEKEQLGPSLLKQLLDEFLFRASTIILNSNSQAVSQQDFHPKCSTVNSRLAAYEVLVMLADSSLTNLQLITKELLSMHHQLDPALTKEFDYLPPVDSRCSSGFVGLKNGGATCYMNAVFQQLYMQPGLSETLLSVDEETDNPDESVFYQVQSLFGHLMESKLQYYVPENFWKIFKMWNKELYVREQQDAYEFFTSLVDQLDEYLKKIGREQIFKNTFQGIFSDQKICKDCPHRYEREETFMALNLGVTSCQSLEISLDQFVRGEVLDGSNAYYCEKCKEKRTTVKRTCIKSLPSVLVIHLMRFGFDWESGRSIKYDEQIRFPWMLNMEPYTVSGMARQDSSSEVGDIGRTSEQGSGGSPRKKVTLTENYELVGVVVHSGQAHAGHYYSFIKDRRGCGKRKWYKFNDTVVEEFDLNDETLEYECFGGEYRPKVYDQSNPYPDVRRRYWNAYMLFYQRMSDQNSPVLPKKSRVSVVRQEADDHSLSAPSSPEISPQSSPRPHRPNNDRLSLLTKLVRKGEKKGLFVEKMPARIYQMVRDENLKFMKNRDVYNSDYFNFVLSLASVNATKLKHPLYQSMAKVSLELAIQFLFQTYLRTKKKLRVDTEEWIATIDVLISKSCEACQWLIEYLIGSEGRELIKIFLLECSVREVRVAVATVLEKTLESALFYQDKGLDALLEVLLALLDKDVPENCKNCSQYFSLFNNFAQKGFKSCQLLYRHSAFRRMISFLLGPNRQNNQNRRWSSAQAREFGFLHNTLSLLVLYSDVSSQRTVAPGHFKRPLPTGFSPSNPLLPIPGDIEALLFRSEAQPYLLEVMFAMRELTGSLSVLIEMVTYCCFCNEHSSLSVLQLIKSQLENAPPHELKNIFQLLHEILVIEDPLQIKRLKFAFESDSGLLALMQQSNNVDSSRCYQCVKFLATLAQKCSAAKEYVKECSNHWSWVVQWLEKKMSEPYWAPQSNISNETSTAKTFQRTISAQDTLAYATALLNEKEQSGSSNGSEGSPGNENGDRSLRQGSESPMILGESKSDLDDVDP